MLFSPVSMPGTNALDIKGVRVKGMVKTCEWYLGSLGGKMSFIEVGDDRGKLLEVDFDFDFVGVDFSVDFLTLTVSSRSFHSRARFCPF
ncbi:hypothetical protein Tco_0566009 [Tanacetum coccineum]